MIIKKKNGKYYCRFQVNGERHFYLCNGAKNLQEARDIENGFRYKLMKQQQGLDVLKPVPLKVLYELFETDSAINKRSWSREKYIVKVLKQDFPPERLSNSLKVSELEKFKLKLQNKRGMSNSTINKYLYVLSKMFHLGINEKLIKENPLLKVKKMPRTNYRIRYLTEEEEERLYETLKTYSTDLEPIITLALQTGMRRGEILNLKWLNVDFDFNLIELLETKSGKSRIIPMSKTVRELLLKQRNNSEYVFINPHTKVKYEPFKARFQTLLKKAGIENFRFHDLRHTVATRLMVSGVDVAVIKELLGHSSVATTMRYAHAVPGRKAEAVDLLDHYGHKL